MGNLEGVGELKMVSGRDTHRRHVNTVFVGEVDELAELVLGEEGEGTTCEFEAVDVVAHAVACQLPVRSWFRGVHSRLEDVFEIPLSHGRIIRPPDLSDAHLPRLCRSGVVADEAKGLLVLEHDFWLLRGITVGALCE